MTKRIELTQGKYALIDDEDFESISQYKWRASPRGTTCYAQAAIRIDGIFRTHLLHRLILNAPKGVPVDHIDGNGLNNTRANLRLATMTQNRHNRDKARKNGGYKGVVQVGTTQRWRARISSYGKHYYLGTFDTPEEAARAYDHAALLYHGEFAWLNFPNSLC